MSASGNLKNQMPSKLPRLYDQDEKGHDASAYVKLFTPWSNWTWYITEYDGEDMCFGLVEGFATEFGYFSLSELEEIQGPMGLKIERDIHWQPTPVSQFHEEPQL